MNQANDKRYIVLNILSGDRKLDSSSPVIEPSLLSALAERPRPKLGDPYKVWFLGIPVVLSICSLCVLFRNQLDTPELSAAALLILGSSILCFWYFSHIRADSLIQHARSLEAPLDELNKLSAELKLYLSNLDRRTSRYFHVVTNSKVTSYFVLTQMMAALESRIQELELLLKSPSCENVLAAHQTLQGTLVFRDAFNPSQGNAHVVPLARIRAVAEQLMDYLNSELSLLESEVLSIEPVADESNIKH